MYFAKYYYAIQKVVVSKKNTKHGGIVMKNRVIIIEGIPGSGKSTSAKKVETYLVEKGIKAKLYNEGSAHPVDMAWNAYLTMKEYRDLLEQYPEYKQVIQEHTQIENEYVTIAYTQLGFYPNENELMNKLEAHEVYDGRVDLATFEKLYLKRWGDFKLEEDEVAIFECAYLQNQIGELMQIHNMPKAYIYNYLLNLLKGIQQYKPLIIYLTQRDVEETIMRVAKERVSPDKSKWEDWIDLVIRSVETCKYGKLHGLKGTEGVIQFYKDRKELELEFINKINEQYLALADVEILANDTYDWKQLEHKLRGIINKRY